MNIWLPVALDLPIYTLRSMSVSYSVLLYAREKFLRFPFYQILFHRLLKHTKQITHLRFQDLSTKALHFLARNLCQPI